MKNDELFDYIKQRLIEGDDKEIIKNKLISAGWQEKDIEEVFSIISNSPTELPSSPSFDQPTISLLSDEEKINKNIEENIIIKPIKSRKKWFLVIGIILLIIIIVGGITLFQRAKDDAKEAEIVITVFLTYMSNENYDSAYGLISNEWRVSATEEEFIQDVKSFRPMYLNFKDITMTGFHVEKYAGKPYTCLYYGIINHKNGEKDGFRAVLYLENGKWRMAGINFNISPDRMKEMRLLNGGNLYNALNNLTESLIY